MFRTATAMIVFAVITLSSTRMTLAADDDVAALVVDNGSGMCTAGLVGNNDNKTSSGVVKNAASASRIGHSCGANNVSAQSSGAMLKASTAQPNTAANTIKSSSNTLSATPQNATADKGGT